MICIDRPYVCKFDNNCSVSVLEIDGVKQKGPRCQACRYQACLDAGMYHSGVQRARGGRHANVAAYGNAKSAEAVDDATWRQNVIDGFVARLKANREAPKFPRMQLPDIGARLHAAHYQSMLLNASDRLNGAKKGEGDEVTVTITPSVRVENGVNGDHAVNGSGSAEEGDDEYEGYNVEMLLEEVKLWKSKHREVSAANEEKAQQIKSYQSQMSIMRLSLAEAKRRNNRNERRIESLEKNLESVSTAGESSSSQNPTLKALLSDTSFSRSISVTAAGKNPPRSAEPKTSGSLTLTPVINPKRRAAAPSRSEDHLSGSKPSSENGDDVYNEEYCDDEPLEPTVIIQTDD